jgi:hypothetical protein
MGVMLSCRRENLVEQQTYCAGRKAASGRKQHDAAYGLLYDADQATTAAAQPKRRVLVPYFIPGATNRTPGISLSRSQTIGAHAR